MIDSHKVKIFYKKGNQADAKESYKYLVKQALPVMEHQKPEFQIFYSQAG
jgi:hypothetical protein